MYEEKEVIYVQLYKSFVICTKIYMPTEGDIYAIYMQRQDTYMYTYTSTYKYPYIHIYTYIYIYIYTYIYIYIYGILASNCPSS